MMAQMIFSAMILGGHNYHSVMHILHMLKEAGEKAWDEFGPDDDDEGKGKRK